MSTNINSNGNGQSEPNGLFLTREALLGAQDLDYREVVTVPHLGHCWVKSLSAEEREAWESAPPNRIRALMVVLTCCDENGNRLFSMRDLDAVSALPINVVMPISDAAIRIAKVAQEDIDRLEKNSDAGPSDDLALISASRSAE